MFFRKFTQKDFGRKEFVPLLIVPIVLLIFLAGYFFWKSAAINISLKKIISNLKKQKGFTEEPTLGLSPGKESNGSDTFEFQQITIPYLRLREYHSSLGKLNEFAQKSNYTSYTTSYDSDGLKIDAYLTIPKSETDVQKYSAIVFVHGYIPPSQYKTTVNYVSYVDYLAKNGFVVFKIDLRGHGNSEGDAGGAYYSGDYIVDTLNAVDVLRNSDFVDQDKVGLWGHSMGGNVVFRSFVVAKNIPAMVIWAGAGYTYSDLQQYMIHDNSYRPLPTGSQRGRDRQRLRELYGNFDPENWFWKMVPATNYLEGVEGAIQVDHAVDDEVVSIEYSRNLMRVLGKSDIKHELFEYPSGGHNITGNSYTKAMQNTVEFFKENLSSK